MGVPKALVTGADGRAWVERTIEALTRGGCDTVSVVVGAAADQVAPLVRAAGAEVVVAQDWADGMGASLTAGLDELMVGQSAAEAALVMLVDLPDVGADVIERVRAGYVDHAGERLGAGVVRASYDQVPGHPVMVGRDHWYSLASGLGGDRGARDWLAGRDVVLVECGDLATGNDVDRPAPAVTQE